MFFDRFERPEIAATVYGASLPSYSAIMILGLPAVADHLRAVLGGTAFDDCVAIGAAMEPADVVRYARQQIELARQELVDPL